MFVVGERNLRSQRALEKIGARRMRFEDRAVGNTMTRTIVFAITRDLTPRPPVPSTRCPS